MIPDLAAGWVRGRVLSCRPEGSLYHRIDIEVGELPAAEPGQFCLLSPGPERGGFDPLLLRPLSLLDAEPGRLAFLLKVFGRGSAALAALREGETLRCLGPLGRPFTQSASPAPLLVGGGVGIPPLIMLSRRHSAAGIAHRVIFGFSTEAEIPLRSLEPLRVDVEICTLDGSLGFRGHPVALLAAEPDRPPARVQACGPEPMLRALRESRRAEDEMELSLEERMACGVGVCRGCVAPVADPRSEDGWRYATVCREGPVFAAETLRPDAPLAAKESECEGAKR